MRQLRLAPAGVQVTFRETITATNGAFAYSSVMAFHVHRLRDSTLQQIIVRDDHAITAICWSPVDPNLMASCAASGRVYIWDLEQEQATHDTVLEGQPILIEWTADGEVLAVATKLGAVHLWEYKANRVSKVHTGAPDSIKVVRCHHSLASRLLIGSSDGSITLHDPVNLFAAGKKPSPTAVIVGKSKTSKDAVTDAQWDLLSADPSFTTMVASFQDGTLALFDASSQREVHSFERQSHVVKSIAWARAQPGNFVTATEKLGLLKLWNASQRAPLLQIKVGQSGVNCLKAIPGEPNWFVLSFKNSSIGICDIANKTMRWSSCSAHSQTIFDVAFKPDDPDVLASVSWDGRVKMWQVHTMESLPTEMSAGADAALYGLSWGPNSARICAVSGQGALFVWRTDTGDQVLRLQCHTGVAYRCEWESNGHCGQIATGGVDGYACVVDPVSGTIVRKLQHPAAVIGVCWHRVYPSVLATGCQDGNVRVYNLLEFPEQPRVICNGHEARVFNVLFHPICPDIIASGSDDKTVRVWNWHPDYQGTREVRCLEGHVSNVRALLWHSEMPNLLFTGSWDSTIRVWDVVASKCIHVAHEHHADVYGLALHPDRPFFLASSSRDTTLRFWNLEDPVRPLFVRAVVRPERIGEMLATEAETTLVAICSLPDAVPPPPPAFHGPASRRLMDAIEEALVPGQPVPLAVYQAVVLFFLYRPGIEDLWGLLAVVRGEPAAKANRSFFHERELVLCQKSKALEMASSRGCIGLGQGKMEERLMRAAQIMLRIGDLRSYCSMVARAGHYEKAICIAPAVSHEFWQEMCNEYLESMTATPDMEDVAPFWVATGKAGKLVDAYIQRCELDSAFAVAKADADGLLPAASRAANAPIPVPQPSPDARDRFEDVTGALARQHADFGEPLQAAMCYLAVSMPAGALGCLSRAHEHVLAYVVADLTGEPQDPAVLKLLAQCAERDEQWHVASELLAMHPRGLDVHLPLLAARCPDKDLARTWWELSPEDHHARFAEAVAAGDRPSMVFHAVCAGEHLQAIQYGVEALHALVMQPGWTVAEARAILDPLESVPLHNMEVFEIASTLACAAYVALVEASQLNYFELIFPLSQTLRNIIYHQNLGFPVGIPDISLLEAEALLAKDPAQSAALFSELCNNPETPQHVRSVCEEHLANMEQLQEQRFAEDGLSRMAGAHMPLCSRRYAKASVLTNELIRGPVFALEDKKMHVSLAEALAWVRVNAFSPLNTGMKIYPV